MDIRHLQYFLEVANTKSFTKAAERLYVTQPTISKMIKNLETELGVTLFDRSGKRVVLTEAGQIILNQAQNIFKSFQNMAGALEDLMNLKTGHIRIGMPPMVGARFFPTIIGRFRELYPGITIQLVENGAKKIEEDVGNGALDIGVVLLPINDNLFSSYPFVKENLRLVIHPAHPMADRQEVSLIELKDESLILFREDFSLHDRIIQACLSLGFEPHIVSESSQWDFISEMVAAKLGVALLPESICQELDKARVKIIDLTRPSIPWNLAVIWRKGHYLSFAAREWLRLTRRLLKET